jgi:aminopeptidase N
MLRRQVGDEAFWDGIRAYCRRYRDGNALTGDFRRAMEEIILDPHTWLLFQGELTRVSEEGR